jgi:uncharacterized membrane protein (DUF373 family)
VRSSTLGATAAAFALWNLVLKILFSIVSSGGSIQQIIRFPSAVWDDLHRLIALEFNRSLLVVAERRHGIVQARTVILIALLAIVRKLMIIDLSAANAAEVFALAAAILALGTVYWLVRDQELARAGLRGSDPHPSVFLSSDDGSRSAILHKKRFARLAQGLVAELAVAGDHKQVFHFSSSTHSQCLDDRRFGASVCRYPGMRVGVRV